MTTGEIIAIVDDREPNQYSTEAKVAWLSNLDGKIIEAVIKRYAPEKLPEPHWPDPLDVHRRTMIPIHEYSEPIEPEEEEEKTDPSGKKDPVKWPYHDLNCKLVVAEPYAEDVYSHYLQAMIASENAETVKYNQQISLYNSAYQEWANWYNRTHMPISARGGNRYHM